MNKSQNLSVEQKAELNAKITAAQGERQVLQQKQKDLEGKLADTQKALDEAKKRNEQLKKELEDAKKDTNTEPRNPPPKQSIAQIGPFQFQSQDKCMSVAERSTADKATLQLTDCSLEEHQLFMLQGHQEKGLSHCPKSALGRSALVA